MDGQRIRMEPKYLNNGKYKILNVGYYGGQGTYGGVFRVANSQGEVFAVKEIKQTIGVQGIYGTVIRQKEFLKQLTHNNIIKLTDDFFQSNKAFLVFPYYNFNLRQLILNHYQNNVPPHVVQKIMTQLLSALKQAHKARIIHRDVKPQNIMIERFREDLNDFTIKLADWGSARKISTGNNRNLTVEVIPIAYRPPELFFQLRKYSQTVDIWSVGCLFYELLMGKRPFQACFPNQIIYQMTNKIGLSQIQDERWLLETYRNIGLELLEEDIIDLRAISLDLPFQAKFGTVPPACDLIKKMLRINPDKRLSVSECLKHPYFNTKNDNDVLEKLFDKGKY